MDLNLKEIFNAINGEYIIGDTSNTFKDVVIDTRKVSQNSIFIAHKGERVDSNKMILDAFKNGATLCVVDNMCFDESQIPNNKAVIKVDNSIEALMSLAKYYRQKLNVKIIGVTGSVGKTSTKDLLAASLSSAFKVFKTDGNYNSQIGLPLMLLQITNDYDVAVLEMGMSDLHQIEKLVDVARPEIGVITNIGLSHIENLKTQENILKAKLEIATYFGPENMLVLNGEDNLLNSVNTSSFKLSKVGFNNNFDINSSNIKLFEDKSVFNLHMENMTDEIVLNVVGKHNVLNFLLSVAVAKELGISLDDVKKGLANLNRSAMRLDIIKRENYTIINDCYNASPDSMKSAIDVLANISASRRICVLGTMKELGNMSDISHEDVANYALSKNVDMVYATGEYTDNFKKPLKDKCMLFNTKEDLIANLKNSIRANDCILVKASRGMKFEDIVNAI